MCASLRGQWVDWSLHLKADLADPQHSTQQRALRERGHFSIISHHLCLERRVTFSKGSAWSKSPQTVAHRPNLAPDPISWNPVMPLFRYCLWLLSRHNGQVNCYRAHVAWKDRGIYHLALDRKGLMIPDVEHGLESQMFSSLVFFCQSLIWNKMYEWYRKNTGPLHSTDIDSPYDSRRSSSSISVISCLKWASWTRSVASKLAYCTFYENLMWKPNILNRILKTTPFELL